MGVSKNSGHLFGSTSNKDHSRLASVLGASISEKTHIKDNSRWIDFRWVHLSEA